MKNTKIFIMLAGIAALLFGFGAKTKSDFQAKLGKRVFLNSELYAASSLTGDCIGADCVEHPKRGG